TGSPLTYCFKSRPHMVMIKGLSFNFHDWQHYYFFVCINSASVVEECIPIFRQRWVRKGIMVGYFVYNPIPPHPEDVFIIRDILRGAPFYWGYFSPRRVSATVEHHRSELSLTGRGKGIPRTSKLSLMKMMAPLLKEKCMIGAKSFLPAAEVVPVELL
ncbi:hypothetical protein HID58_070401, partial [Brassica napus]